MELTLLGITGLAAFLVVGGAVMLIASFRRTIELRNALVAALERIERLEQRTAAPPPQVEAARREQLADYSAPTPAPEPARIEPAPARAPPPPLPPPPPTAEPATAAAEATPLQAEPVAPAAPAEEEAPTEAQAARVAPPQLGVIGFIAALGTFAALAAATESVVDGGLGVGIALIVGLAVLAAAEWRRSAEAAETAAPFGLKPSVLTALMGVAVMLTALLYGRAALDAPAPMLSFLGLAATSLCTALLALRHGAWLMGAGVAVALTAPAYAPDTLEGPVARYGFLLAFAGLSMWLARARLAPGWAWIGAAIALGWGCAAAFSLDEAAYAATGSVFFTSLALFALAAGWSGAAPAPVFPIFWAERRNWPEARVLAHLLFAAAGVALVTLVLTRGAPAPAAAICVASLAGLACAAAALRPGLYLTAFIAALACAAAIALWPAGANGIADAPGLLLLASVLGLCFSTAGWMMMLRAESAQAGATLAALAPIAVFATLHWRIGDGFGAPYLWALAALTLAGLNGLSYVQLARAKQEAAGPFAAAAALGLALGAYAVTPAPYAPLALAFAIPLIALIDRWRAEPALRYAGVALCALAFVRLVAPQLFVATAGGLPILALHLAPSALACFAAAYLFSSGPAGAQSRAAVYPFALGLVLIACLGTLALRHQMTAGDIGAPYASLIEMGANTLIWLALAAALALRFGPAPRASLAALEYAAFAGAAIHALLAGLALINPWWGLAPAPAPGWRGFNAIELGYAAPGVAFGAYAWLRARQGLGARAAAAGLVSVALLFTALILELRRLFHGAVMASAPVGTGEAWVYSLAMLGFAALLAAFAVERAARALRYGALLLALAAVFKMAFFDLEGLEGLARIAAVVGFLTAGGVMTMFYSRYVLQADPERFKQVRDPNLMPPL